MSDPTAKQLIDALQAMHITPINPTWVEVDCRGIAGEFGPKVWNLEYRSADGKWVHTASGTSDTLAGMIAGIAWSHARDEGAS